MKSAIIFGSITGKTEEVAEKLVETLAPEIEPELVAVESLEATDLAKWDFIICGIPTWDIGELEYGWQDIYDKLDDVDLNGTKVAMFGLGDQSNYADTYQDAMGILYRKLLECGVEGGIGFTSTDGHTFVKSEGVIDGKFCGMAIDEDCQFDLTEERIDAWTIQLKEYWAAQPT